MIYNLFVQSLALVFLLLFAISYHAKTRKTMLSIQFVGVCVFALHFFLLHAWSGFAVQVIHSAAILLFISKEKNNFLGSRFLLAFFIALYFISTLLTWQGYFSIFAFLGISFGTLAKWQTKPNSIRTLLLFTGILWIIYDLFVNSYGGIITEIILIISGVISLINNKKIEVRP